MKKFKDFLYDKNDILIAVLILVVAASIIAWRMDVILQYPKQLIHNDKQIETPTVDPSKTDDTSKGDNKDDANKDGDAATGNGSDANTGNNGADDANSGTGTQGTTELWAAGALTRDVEVDVSSRTTQSTSRSAPSPVLTMKKSRAVPSPLKKAPPRQLLPKK